MYQYIVPGTLSGEVVEGINNNFTQLFTNAVTPDILSSRIAEQVSELVGRKLLASASTEFIKTNPEYLKYKTDSRQNYLNINQANDVTFFMNIADSTYASYRYFKDSSDEFLKGYENKVLINSLGLSAEETSYSYSNVTRGKMIGDSSTANHYAMEVGTTIEFTFDGSAIYLNVLAMSNGGAWRAYVDGVDMGLFSTYSPTSIYPKHTIAENLFDGTHTLKLMFIGQDPENPVSNPRGWVRSGGATPTFVVKKTKIKTNTEFSPDFTSGFSNKEYAIKATNPTTNESEFFPMHNNVQTSYKGNRFVRQLIVDGEVVDLTKARNAVYFTEAELTQVVEHRLPNDTAPRAEVVFRVIFKDGKTYNDIKIKWLQETKLTSGYIMQIPALDSWVSSFVTETEKVAKKETSTNDSTDFKSLSAPKISAISSQAKWGDYYIVGEIEEFSDPVKKLWVNHRTDKMQKLYPQVYNGVTKAPGTLDRFKFAYSIQKLPNAGIILDL